MEKTMGVDERVTEECILLWEEKEGNEAKAQLDGGVLWCWLGGGERFPTASSLPHGGDLARWGNDNTTSQAYQLRGFLERSLNIFYLCPIS